MSDKKKISLDAFGDNYNQTEFIDNLSRKLVFQQKLDFEDGRSKESFNAEQFIKIFENSLQQIDALSLSLEERIKKAQSEKKSLEKKYNEKYSQFCEVFEQNLQIFSEIEHRVDIIGNKTIQIGDNIEIIDRQNDKAEESLFLITQFAILNSDQLSREIEEIKAEKKLEGNEKVYERVMSLKKLNSIAQELSGKSTLIGRKKIEEILTHLELHFCTLFNEFYSDNDLPQMKECARILLTFNGGENLIKMYLSNLSIFKDPIKQSSSALNQNQIERMFRDISDTFKKEEKIIQKIFPYPDLIMLKLTQKIYLQKIQIEMEKGLNKVVRKEGEMVYKDKAEEELHEWLSTLNNYFEFVIDLTDELEEYQIKDLDLKESVRSLFADYFREYEEREVRWLEISYLEKLVVFNNSIAFSSSPRSSPSSSAYPLSTSPPQRRGMGNSRGNNNNINNVTSRPPSIFDAMQGMSENVVEFIRYNKEAIDRCKNILAYYEPNLKGKIIQKIFSTLAEYLGFKYIAIVVDIAIEGIPKLDDSPPSSSLNSSSSSTPSPSSAPFFNLIPDEKYGEFLRISQQITQIIMLIQSHFYLEVITQLGVCESSKMQATQIKNFLLLCLEDKISLGLEKTLSLSLSKLDFLLSSMQKKKEFFITDLDSSDFDPTRSTLACKGTIGFASQFYREMKNCLDGNNFLNFEEEFGLRFYSLLLKHIKKQQISLGLGGMKLFRDLTEYREFGIKFESKKVRDKFEILKDIANIHIVPPENLQALMEGTHLSSIDKDELMTLIHLRSDQKQYHVNTNVDQSADSQNGNSYFTSFQSRFINRKFFNF